MFSITPLSLEDWGTVIAISFPVLILDEVVKFVSRVLFKNRSPLSPKLKAD